MLYFFDILVCVYDFYLLLYVWPSSTILGDPSIYYTTCFFECYGGGGLQRLERHHMRHNILHDKPVYMYSDIRVGDVITRPHTTSI